MVIADIPLFPLNHVSELPNDMGTSSSERGPEEANRHLDSDENETLMNCTRTYCCVYDKNATKEEKCVERDKHN